jgi:hypothetical protein
MSEKASSKHSIFVELRREEVHKYSIIRERGINQNGWP